MQNNTFHNLFHGPPKKRQKKASSTSTVTSIVVATTGSGMVFPYNEVVANATHKPKRVKKGAKKGGHHQQQVLPG
jgi:hypothetical protein